MVTKSGNQPSSLVLEPEKRIPVVCETDVVVAGSGLSGSFAALSAARHGAKTMVIDRFGALGGNIGPGTIIGGSISDGAIVVSEGTLGSGNDPVYTEFMSRVGWDPEVAVVPGGGYLMQTTMISHVLLQMMEEAKVELMLSSYVSDVIVEDGRVAGLFVENKSGRQAVRARVVIDATGDASVADRAGAAIIRQVTVERLRRNVPHLRHIPLWNELGVYVTVSGIDWDKYQEFLDSFEGLTEEDQRWLDDNYTYSKLPKPLVPLARQGAERGEYQIPQPMVGLDDVMLTWTGKFLSERLGEDSIGNRVLAIGAIDTGNAAQITTVETRIRAFIFESTEWLNKYVPGYEKAYVKHISPYLGARGGPCIEGAYTLTPDVVSTEGSCEPFDDVIYMVGWKGAEDEAQKGEDATPRIGSADIPYRILVPKELDGLLATGRCAAYLRRGARSIPPLRGRTSMIAMGCAAGTAAALAAKNNVVPRNLDVKLLQRTLLADGCYLGNAARLKELGL